MPFDLRPDVLLALALSALWVGGGIAAILRMRAARSARMGDRLGYQSGKPLGRLLVYVLLAAALIAVVVSDIDPNLPLAGC